MQMELLHCLDISTIGLHQGMIRAIDTNLDYMYLLSEVLLESHSAEPKESKSVSLCFLAKRPRTARCSASVGGYGRNGNGSGLSNDTVRNPHVYSRSFFRF